MKRFAQLYAELDAATATTAKLDALKRYLADADTADAAWAVYWLCGGKTRRSVSTPRVRELAAQATNVADWLFEECYATVGDLAETLALLWPDAAHPPPDADVPLHVWGRERLPMLAALPPPEREALLVQWLHALDAPGRFLLIKLMGGGFRVGASRALVQRALAEHAGIAPTLVAERMMGYTDARHLPDATSLIAICAVPRPQAADSALSLADPVPATGGQPYPFFLAHPLAAGTNPADALGDMQQWLAEWKYDGIRAQLVRRGGQVWLWSRGEELMTERFPELAQAALAQLPDGCVLDGEVLVWPPGQSHPAPFAQLQQRIARKTLPRTLLARLPAAFVAYDLLEQQGQDLRAQPQQQRREALQALAAPWATPLQLSPLLAADDWPQLAQQRAQARAIQAEGLMLKHAQAPYGIGRSKAGSAGVAGAAPRAWVKWKLDPFTVDAVLIYAQAGHGRRANLFTDYTFAAWSRSPHDAAEAQAVCDAIAARTPAVPGALQLVAFAKAYSGLTDAEMAQVDRVVRATTLEKFGPVRSVRPTLVMELAFEGIGASPRHKSGLALRFPRLARLRPDKPLHEAVTVAELHALMGSTGQAHRSGATDLPSGLI